MTGVEPSALEPTALVYVVEALAASGGRLRFNGAEHAWGSEEAPHLLERALEPEGGFTLHRHARFSEIDALILEDLAVEFTRSARALGLTLGILQLRRANDEQAAELSRVGDHKGEILRTISHELRTPLATIEGFAKTMLDDEAMPREIQVEFLQIVCDEAIRMRGMVDDIISLSRQKTGRLKYDFHEAPLSELIRASALRVQLQAREKGLSVEVDIIDEVTCRLDPPRFTRVLINLLENALKYTEEGGIHITQWREGAWAHLSVRDTGIGIPQAHLPFIFERFYRVEDAGLGGEGLGLGLALVEGIVKDHGGRIRVESAEGEGSAFIISIQAIG